MKIQIFFIINTISEQEYILLFCSLMALKHENEIDRSGKQSGIEVKLWLTTSPMVNFNNI